MNNGNSEEEALKTLCKDVSALKEVIAEGLSFLKERSQEITRLERRIEASYPEYKAFKTPKSQPIEVTKEKLQDVFNALATPGDEP
jgi:hypothetical protein